MFALREEAQLPAFRKAAVDLDSQELRLFWQIGTALAADGRGRSWEHNCHSSWICHP